MYGRGIYVKQGSQWVEIQQPFVNTNGTWSRVNKGYVKRNGSWQQFFPSTGTETETAPGNYSWTVPPGIYSLNVNVVGGGGGGGGSTEVGNGAGGGGGGGGGVRTQTISVTPGQVLQIRVGAGGAGAPFVGRDPGASGNEGPGSDGGDSWITVGGTSVVATGGKGGASGVGDPGGGGGGGCCVVSTAFAETGIWNRRQRDELIVWCEQKLHNKTLGECFRRGYQVLGSKLIVPALKSKLGKKYYKWAFNNGTNLVRGKKFSWLSVPNSIAWIAGFMLVGAVVTTDYANKSWKSLYKDRS